MAVIESADFVVRHADDAGHRIAVICPALGAPFIYDQAVAARRVAARFQHLPESYVDEATWQLERRARYFMKQLRDRAKARTSWVFGWKHNEEA